MPVVVSESTSLLLSNNDDGVLSLRDDESDDIKNGDDKKLFRAIAALSFVFLVQSYLLISVFPYSGFLAMHLIPDLDEETAGSYAGFIAASFMAGRTFSSFEWGKAADRYGRVFVIKLSLLLCAALSILFGLAPTYLMALVFRFLLGLCNGIIGPIKTLVSEYAKGDQKKETKMMGIVLGMWGYGFLINPAISGYLSDPIKQYPDAEWVTLFHPILIKYPFLPPNIVGCFFCLVGYLVIHNFVDETLPKEKRHQFRPMSLCRIKNTTIIRSNVLSLIQQLPNHSKGELSEEQLNINPSPTTEEKGEETATIHSLMKRKSTRQHLLVFWIYAFLMITLDEIFPLYCISKTSGLGITEKIIGNILSGTGLFYLAVQYFLLMGLVDKYGFYHSLRIGTFLSVPMTLFMPISLITNEGADGTLTLTSLIFLSVLYAIIRSFSSVVFSTITMTTNQTVPVHQRGTMNGLSMLGVSLARALGPLFGGILFSTSVRHVTPPFGSVVVYGIMTFLGICLGIQALLLREFDETREN